MSQLSKLQQAFQHHVLEPTDGGVPAWVRAGRRSTPEKQLFAYVHAYRARLQEVLENDFPAIAAALGEDNFEALAKAYINTHPSHNFSLRVFGGHVADFLAQQAAYQEQPWLSELAHFEWTLGQAFDAANAPLFSEQEMAAIPAEDWPGLRFTMHPSVQRLDCRWNAPGMWQALTADEPEEVDANEEETVPWLVWRQELVTRFRSLEREEQLALDALRSGASFDEVCDVLSTVMSEDAVPRHFASLLKGWISQGMISAIAD